MTKHIHIYLHRARVADAGSFKEGDHPRASNGQFGSGGGGKAAPAAKTATKKNSSNPELKAKLDKMRSEKPHLVASKAEMKASKAERAKPDLLAGVRADNGGGYQPKAKNNLTDRPSPKGKEPSDSEMAKHPQYTKEDHEYLKGKGWTNSEIQQRWDAEGKSGKAPVFGKNTSKIPNVTGVIGNKNFYQGSGTPVKRQPSGTTVKHQAPPTGLSHKGKKFTQTGKSGKSDSGETMHEYEAVDGEGRRTGARVWRTAAGKIIED